MGRVRDQSLGDGPHQDAVGAVDLPPDPRGHPADNQSQRSALPLARPGANSPEGRSIFRYTF